MPIVTFDNLKKEYIRVLTKRNMREENAERLANSFATMGWEGVYSHGINRFPVFISQVDAGDIDLNAEPIKMQDLGALEQWDCKCGPGPLNGDFGIRRAIEKAEVNGVGVVALKNSNHWMRGGTYALYAARQGYASIAVTNSIASYPAWGGKTKSIGTNPLILAIPGNPPALLDMSCSQYSYGKLEVAQLAGKELEVAGGYDENGVMSTDPEAIKKSARLLPAGYWKGSGLAIVLDMLVTLLSGGNSTAEITEDIKKESAVSQILIAFDTKKTIPENQLHEKFNRIVDFTKNSVLINEDNPIRIPGESIEKFIKIHKEQNGMPINDNIWSAITSL